MMGFVGAQPNLLTTGLVIKVEEYRDYGMISIGWMIILKAIWT
jgi:hypothetical protein